MLAVLILALILVLLFGGLGFLYNPLFWIIAIVFLLLAAGGGYYGRGRGYWT